MRVSEVDEHVCGEIRKGGFLGHEMGRKEKYLYFSGKEDFCLETNRR